MLQQVSDFELELMKIIWENGGTALYAEIVEGLERLDAIMRFKKTTRLLLAISIALVLALCLGATAAGAYVIPKKASDAEVLNDSNESNQMVDSQNAVSDIKINVKNCNVIILPSDDTNFKYEYDKELFQVSEQVENHSITITAHSLAETSDQPDFSQDIRIRIYIPGYAVSAMNIEGESAGISVLPFNTNINLTNYNGTASVCLDEHFNKKLIFVSISGSGALYMQDEFNDYSLSASIINSPFLPREDMPDFHDDSQPYTFVSGKGTASIKLGIQDNAFAIYKYSGEAVDLLKTHFDIVT